MPIYGPEEENSMTDKAELLELITGAVARGWCHPDNSHKEMDATLAMAIADEVHVAILRKLAEQPENEPIGMLLDFLSTRPRNIIKVELCAMFPGEDLTLGHLCKFTRSEVLKFPNCGRKSVREIEEYLRPRGLWWRGEP